jgi:hypothetical protein
VSVTPFGPTLGTVRPALVAADAVWLAVVVDATAETPNDGVLDALPVEDAAAPVAWELVAAGGAVVTTVDPPQAASRTPPTSPSVVSAQPHSATRRVKSGSKSMLLR